MKKKNTLELDIKISPIQREMFFPFEQFPKYNICPKGRRSGATQGAANAFILYGLQEDFRFLPRGPIFLLWVEVINSNILKYVDRYFMPVLRQLEPGIWQWKQQEQILRVGRATIYFKSAEKPESIEGFGFHMIFLNEAGIILQDEYLYNNSILPMLMDYPNSKLIAAGTPKGKRTKNGVHKFFELYQKAQHDPENYRIVKFTGRNNPFIDRKELEMIAASMDEATRRQEIEGEFTDISEMLFLYAFNESKHVVESYTPNPHLPLLISFDFNKNPMTCVIGQALNSNESYIFDEIEMNHGSTPEVCDVIKERYKRWTNSIFIDITGDATGHNRSALIRGNLNHYRIIKQELGVLDRNLLVEKTNPAHKDSRVLCNSVLQNARHFITRNCPGLINDLMTANVDHEGELIKDQKMPLHLFDCWRYFIHAQYKDFIRNPSKYQ